MRKINPLVLLIVYTLLVIPIFNQIPTFIIGNIQLFLVVLYTLKWGLNGGVKAAIYGTILLFLKFFYHHSSVFDIHFILGIISYFVIAIGIGRVIDDIRLNRDDLVKEVERRKEVEEALRRNKEKIEGLHSTAIEMENCQKEEDIYQLTVNAAEKILDFDVCSLDIVEGENLIVKAVSSGVPEDGVVSGSIYEGIAGKCYRHGRSYLTRDISKDSDASPVKSQYRSAITVPVEKFGIFQVISTKVNDFDEEDLELVELLIAHTSAALKRLKAEEKIRYLGYYDELTGLYNRSYFEQELKRLDYERQLPLSIIMGDLNSLKLTNDAFNHKAGDRLIKTVANILQESTRRNDIIARWGGDEFVILLPYTDIKEAEKIKERIKSNCQKQDTVIPISISLGVAVKETPGKDIEEVLKIAEDRMYKNKLYESKLVKETILNSLKKDLIKKGIENQEHLKRLTDLALEMGKVLELSEVELNRLKNLIIFKDIGLINVPSRIYDKYYNSPGELTETEWREIKKHAEISYHIAKSFEETASVAEEILYHHERWDGTGFPRELKGKKIPLLSRIVAIIDSYDRMVNGTFNGRVMDEEEVFKVLKENAGKKYDPDLVDVFIDLHNKEKTLN